MAEQPPASLEQRVLSRLRTAQQSLAVAESLTGGLVIARVVDVPGASDVLRGGVIAYATDLKTRLLGVDADLLRRHGAVHADVALAMAAGVRERLDADWGLATTGVAGPDSQDGIVAGTAFVAVVGPGTRRCRRLDVPGDRAAVRAGVTDAALELVLAELEPGTEPSPLRSREGTEHPGTRGS